ncbi:MAG: hypothetical protein WD021_04670 [Rhodothermales bacterium]
MSSLNVNDILGKLNELRAVFVLGQRALPFIEEVFAFLSEVAPLMEEINASMMDSALLVPHATSQLQSISEATKTASAEILDLIDDVMVQSAQYEGELDRALHDVKRIEALGVDTLRILREAIPDRSDVLALVEQNVENGALHVHNLESSIHARRTVIGEIREQMNQIAMSLQVQDCTAQQIASVTHLLDNMRTRMAELLERLDKQSTPTDYTPDYDVPENASFNPDARYENADEKQQAADALIAAMQKGTHDETDAGVDRIFKNAALAMELRRPNDGDDE